MRHALYSADPPVLKKVLHFSKGVRNDHHQPLLHRSTLLELAEWPLFHVTRRATEKR